MENDHLSECCENQRLIVEKTKHKKIQLQNTDSIIIYDCIFNIDIIRTDSGKEMR